MPGIQKIKGIANLEILQKFQENFLYLTGLCVGFYNLKAECVAAAALKRKYCNAAGKAKAPAGLLNCHRSVLNACKTAHKNKEPLIFTCHAGLTEAVIPIIINGKTIGFAVTGQVRISGKSKAAAVTFINSLRKAEPRIGKYFRDAPEISLKKLKVSIDTLSLVINYIFKKENEFLTISQNSDRNNYTHKIVQKAVRFIKANCRSKDISLNKAAESIHISPFYFSHVFNKEMHVTFKDYLTSVRLEETVKMIKKFPEKSMKEIAFESGYDDQYYFSKVFKKTYKISPARFRKQFL